MSSSIVAIYPSHMSAENAVKELQRSAFDMKISRAKEILRGAMPSTLEHHEGTFNGDPTMTTHIDIKVEGRNTPFALDWQRHRWQSLKKQEESAFPLITVLDGRRYELYSDETFAEVEK